MSCRKFSLFVNIVFFFQRRNVNLFTAPQMIFTTCSVLVNFPSKTFKSLFFNSIVHVHIVHVWKKLK